MTASEIYHQAIKPLPPADRLRLAAMILNGIAAPADSAVDVDDSWAQADLDDFTVASLACASKQNAEESDSRQR